MPSRTRTPSDHHEIASALTALYTMMDSLVLLSNDHIFLPPHPDHMFNAENALEAGFSQEAVDALQQIPYLATGSVEFLPSTNAICWVNEDPDVEFYHNKRDNLPDFIYKPVLPSAIYISSLGLYRYVFIYNALTSK